MPQLTTNDFMARANAVLTLRRRAAQRGEIPRTEQIREEASRCAASLSYYISRAWNVVEPTTTYVHNWHIDIICEYLTALTNLEIQNLIINIPPRHMKSLLTVVMWPTWVWLNDPSSRWLTGSYSMSLSTRDARKSRNIIQSLWYQKHFGDRYQLSGDQNVKSRYENTKTGVRLAFGMDTMFTGEGGDYIVVDDALKAQDKDSEIARGNVNETWDTSLSTRANDLKTVRRVIVGQRLHEDDLSGHVMAKMSEEGAHQYEMLILPARYEPKRFVSSIGLADPRRKDGALLWPERFDEKEMVATELDLGPRDAAGQLQQRPSPAGGAIFLREWFEREINRYDPRDEQIHRTIVARWLFYDTAFKDKQSNDPSARIVFELTPDYRILLREAWWKRMQVPQVTDDVNANTIRWNYDKKLRGTVVEDKASGTAVIQTLRQAAHDDVAPFLAEYNPGSISKTERGRQASVWCERNCVILPWPDESVPWVYDFEELLFNWPGTKIDDPQDAFSMGILYLSNLLMEGWRLKLGRRLRAVTA